MRHPLRFGPLAAAFAAFLLLNAPLPAQTAPATSQNTTAPATLPAGKPITVKAVPGQIIKYPNDLQQVRAYWVTPEGKGPWPAVIVAHDIYGLTPWIRKEADALATQGYAVLIPDLFDRLAMPDGAPDARLAWICYEKTPDQQVMTDLRAAVNYLAASPDVGPRQRIAIVGYDMGGIYSMMLAATDLRIKAAVNYYGRILYPEITTRRPVSPVELLFNLRAPLLSFYGAIDPQVPADHLRRLESRLQHNPNETWFDIVKYPEVGHGFLVETRQGYNAPAAADTRAKTRDFLARVLHAPPPPPEED